MTLDRNALCRALEKEVGDPAFCSTFIETRPHLFSNIPLFLAESDISGMIRIVHAIESASRLAGYRDTVLSRAPEIARRDFGPRGGFHGLRFPFSRRGTKADRDQYQRRWCFSEFRVVQGSTGLL
jgi:hypothetical protein